MVTKIVYSRRFNLGDYQHEEVSVEASLDEHSGTPEEVLLGLRDLVAEHCTLRLRQKALEAHQAARKSQPQVQPAAQLAKRNGNGDLDCSF